MTSENYLNKIIAGIGSVRANATLSNYFPLVGDSISIDTKTKWVQRITFSKDDGGGTIVDETVANTDQSTSSSVTIAAEGDLAQHINVSNSISILDINKMAYALSPREEPYFNAELTSEIVRTSQSFKIKVIPENGYDFSRASMIVAKIYHENNYETIVVNNTSFSPVIGGYETEDITILQRGIYDILITITDSSGESHTRQFNKLLTIVPRLAAKPTQDQIDANDYTVITTTNVDVLTELRMYETGVNDLYIECTCPVGREDLVYYQGLDVHKIPSGYSAYTLVLKDHGLDMPTALIFNGSTDTKVSNVNGSPQFSYDNPLVVTIDQDTPLVLRGIRYYVLMTTHCMNNIIIDGKGYYDLEKGIVMTGYKDVGVTFGILATEGTSDIETYEVEIHHVNFTAFSSKTEKTSKTPQFWYGNFNERNFKWHHSHVYDTIGEGCYIGYFTPESHPTVYNGDSDMTFVNLNGETVTYVVGQTYDMKAHGLDDLRIYRNKFERTGFDGMQISNSYNCDVCYNIVDYAATKMEANQSSGLSVQSVSGNVYNNVITHTSGIPIQIGPLGNVNFFNNIANNTLVATSAIQMLFSLSDPIQNPTGGGTGVINNDIQIWIHNNILISEGATINGRNTVQIMNVICHDNLLVNNGEAFSNMEPSTLDYWESIARTNKHELHLNFIEDNDTLKIADRNNSNFMLASSSPLVQGGTGTYFNFDFRGYHNWYERSCPIGPFMGAYKDFSLIVLPLSILTFSTIDDVNLIYSRNALFKYTIEGTATKYRLAESLNDLSSAAWLDIPIDQILPYQLSDGYGLKVVYIQLANTLDESNILSYNIKYAHTPVVLNSIEINGGAASTTDVNLLITASYTGVPTHYRIGEIADLTGKTWLSLTPTIAYEMISAQGRHTIYVQLKDDVNESAVVSANIELIVSTLNPDNIYINFSPDSSIIPNVNNVRYLSTGSNLSLVRADGTGAGKITSVTSTLKYYSGTTYLPTGVVPSNDLGLDELASFCGGGSSAVGVSFANLRFDLPAGTYKFKLFASCIGQFDYADAPSATNLYYKLIGQTTENLVPKNYSNSDYWMEATLETDNGAITLDYGYTDLNHNFQYICVNALIIEKITI